MRHFLCLAQGLETRPLVRALWNHAELWNEFPQRTMSPGTPVSECDDIFLRFQPGLASRAGDVHEALLPDTHGSVGATDVHQVPLPDGHESVWYPAAQILPEARPLIFACMQLVQGERLGRVLITRLPPGGRIQPHMDADANSRYWHFYHLLLAGSELTQFRCGREVVFMMPGELWLFDNLQQHELHNGGLEDRLSLIVAVKK